MPDQHFLYLIRPRPGFIETMTPAEEAVMDEHFAYLQSLQARGSLRLAGPCLDGAFGIVLLIVDSAEEAQGMMEADPAVRSGIVQAEIHPFKISLS